MLVLTRKLGQNVVIGDNISVKVLNIDNNKVQLGIHAPTNVTIYRQELIEKIKKQNQSSVVRQKTEILSAARLLKGLFATNREGRA